MPFFLQTMTGAGAPCAGHQRDEEWLRRKNWVSATLSRLGLAGKKKGILSNYKSSWVQETLAMAIFLSSQV